MPCTPPSVVKITPTPLEISSRALSPQNVEKALLALHYDGMVVIENVVSHSHLDALNSVMIEDAKELRARGQARLHNFHKNNIQQDPPVTDKDFYEDIYLNPFAIQITNAKLGPKPKMIFLSGNTAWPKSTESQPVHSDGDFRHIPIPFSLVVNVPLVSITASNGSTEVWLGSHLHGATEKIDAALLDARREISPPIQPEVAKGSVIIRDPKLWHCGKPNPSDEIRIMLAMIHFSAWYRNETKLKFPKGGDVERRIRSVEDKLEVPVEWVEGEVDHLTEVVGKKYDFSQTD